MLECYNNTIEIYKNSILVYPTGGQFISEWNEEQIKSVKIKNTPILVQSVFL